jgi:hypothetical protein
MLNIILFYRFTNSTKTHSPIITRSTTGTVCIIVITIVYNNVSQNVVRERKFKIYKV